MSKTHKLVIFDTETNGFRGSSVLSVSITIIDAIIDEQLNLESFLKVVDFNRFYYPVEFEYDAGAYEAHKLDKERIAKIRKEHKGPPYPEYFLQDEQIANVFKDKEALFIAHNIAYDRDLIRIPLKKTFCTMLSNAKVLKIPGPYKNTFKNPKLIEAAQYYKVIKDEQEGVFHESKYDTELCALIVWRMLKSKNTELLTALGYTEEEIFKATQY